MGVPAFYRWLSEKYPKIVVDMLEKRAAYIDGMEIPIDLTEPNPNGIEYDNLYVDMNGLIHPCSHPEDREPPSSEEEMYLNVTKYLDRLFNAVRPRKLLYLAIDGVAPRAKMNQQRSRRFRAAKDAKDRQSMMKEVVEEIHELGLTYNQETHAGHEWDSNVITPGTSFMYKLSQYIRFYILDRMNKYEAWRCIQVIFSDANEPGEGEHKIMKYIRSQRCQIGYNPNQYHILHGLDADLIMLALATHEPNFTILRELVTFGNKKERDNHGQISQAQLLLNTQSGYQQGMGNPQDEWVYNKPLQALHIFILREYLEAEFRCLQPVHILNFPYDLERIIDDFVFMCFFVGNDFLPHLPSLDIRDGAIDFLLEVYKDILPSLDSYITTPGGNVNLTQADILLAKVGEIEDIIFQRRKMAEDSKERYHKEKQAKVKQSSTTYVAGSVTTVVNQIHVPTPVFPNAPVPTNIPPPPRPPLLPSSHLSSSMPRPPAPTPLMSTNAVLTNTNTTSSNINTSTMTSSTSTSTYQPKKFELKLIPLNDNKTAAMTLREKILGQKRALQNSNSTAAVSTISEVHESNNSSSSSNVEMKSNEGDVPVQSDISSTQSAAINGTNNDNGDSEEPLHKSPCIRHESTDNDSSGDNNMTMSHTNMTGQSFEVESGDYATIENKDDGSSGSSMEASNVILNEHIRFNEEDIQGERREVLEKREEDMNINIYEENIHVDIAAVENDIDDDEEEEEEEDKPALLPDVDRLLTRVILPTETSDSTNTVVSTDITSIHRTEGEISDTTTTDTGTGTAIDSIQIDTQLGYMKKSIAITKDDLKVRLKTKESELINRYKETTIDNIRLHESGWKSRYYEDGPKKANLEENGGLIRMCRMYVEGLCWVYKYYYEGCPSWNWYYPFHYAPFASDLINIDQYSIQFELSKPFHPIEQLLAVLPSESVHALPQCCQWLMIDPTSPIYDLYDSDIPMDTNGKHLPWLWILLLPFIKEQRIIQAFNACKDKMTLEERRRNIFSGSYLFIHKNHHIATYLLHSSSSSTITTTESGTIVNDVIDSNTIVCQAHTNEVTLISSSKTLTTFQYIPDIERNTDILEALKQIKNEFADSGEGEEDDGDIDDHTTTTYDNKEEEEKQKEDNKKKEEIVMMNRMKEMTHNDIQAHNKEGGIVEIKEIKNMMSNTRSQTNSEEIIVSEGQGSSSTDIVQITSTTTNMEVQDTSIPQDEYDYDYKPEALSYFATNNQENDTNIEPMWFTEKYRNHIPPVVYFNHVVGEGVCGIVHVPPLTWYAPLHTRISAPKIPYQAFLDISSNHVLCISIILPPESAYQSVVLPGHRYRERTLTSFDTIPRRPPRLNKGFNMLDISNKTRQQQQGYQREDRGSSFQTQGYMRNQQESYNQYNSNNNRYGNNNSNSSQLYSFHSNNQSGNYNQGYNNTNYSQNKSNYNPNDNYSNQRQYNQYSSNQTSYQNNYNQPSPSVYTNMNDEYQCINNRNSANNQYQDNYEYTDKTRTYEQGVQASQRMIQHALPPQSRTNYQQRSYGNTGYGYTNSTTTTTYPSPQNHTYGGGATTPYGQSSVYPSQPTYNVHNSYGYNQGNIDNYDANRYQSNDRHYNNNNQYSNSPLQPPIQQQQQQQQQQQGSREGGFSFLNRMNNNNYPTTTTTTNNNNNNTGVGGYSRQQYPPNTNQSISQPPYYHNSINNSSVYDTTTRTPSGSGRGGGGGEGGARSSGSMNRSNSNNSNNNSGSSSNSNSNSCGFGSLQAMRQQLQQNRKPYN